MGPVVALRESPDGLRGLMAQRLLSPISQNRGVIFSTCRLRAWPAGGATLASLARGLI
jgi:hypothetical protein